jgi:protein involved in polysaccharide export with SLBB domain
MLPALTTDSLCPNVTRWGLKYFVPVFVSLFMLISAAKADDSLAGAAGAGILGGSGTLLRAGNNIAGQGGGSTNLPPAGSAQATQATSPSASASSPAAMFSPFLGPLAPLSAPNAPTVLPPPPIASPTSPLAAPPVFGSNMFNGRFLAEQFTGFNPQYQIHVSDQITLRMWGAFTYESVVSVDPQGNIFIPNVGPVHVLGVRNGDLNRHVEASIRSVYRANVGVYATLAAAQQVKVYVTGFVPQPGLYGGLSSDSVLYYLDKAGGIDGERGSFLDVSVLRGGRLKARFNLYDFLLNGQIEPLQLIDGDTIVVAPRKHTVSVAGEVTNAYRFEFARPEVYASEVLGLARPKASATHISIVRKEGPKYQSEYHPIGSADGVLIRSGDEVTVTADKYPGTILVRVEGANLGPHTLVLPYGARLKDATARMKPAPQANPAAAQLFRKSVAVRQKEMLENSLRTLQAMVLTPRSSTSEEADLRQKDAQLALQFIERARNIQPIGQVVLGPRQDAPNVLLADEDVIRIPEATNLVMVHGEVVFPNAVVFTRGASVDDYIDQAGGYTQNGSNSRVLVLHQDGTYSTDDDDTNIRPGDEIMVLPKVDTKNWEFARTIAQILFYLGVAARVVI